jgi:hypothetical protein
MVCLQYSKAVVSKLFAVKLLQATGLFKGSHKVFPVALRSHTTSQKVFLLQPVLGGFFFCPLIIVLMNKM